MEPSQGGTFQASRECFTQKSIVPGVKDHCLVKVQHMILGSEEPSYIANGGMTNPRGGS